MEQKGMQSVTQFSAVVLGNMNPSIHQPAWYQAVGIMKDGNPFALGVVTPQVAQFQGPSVQVQCLPDKWSVTGKPGTDQQTVVDVAAKTFERLNDTPVRAFGLNTATETRISTDESAALAAHLGQPFAGRFGAAGPHLESLTTRYVLGDLSDTGWLLRRQLRVTVAPRPKALVVSTNVDHQIGTTSQPGSMHFSLTPMLEAASAVFGEVATFVETLTQRLIDRSA